jgi:hypothetical protein
MLINIASLTSLVIANSRFIAATESQLEFAQGSLDSSNPPYDFVMFAHDRLHLGTAKATWAAFATLVTGLHFPEATAA